MKSMDFRKQFDGSSWGNWTYKASDDTLNHSNGYYIWDFDNIVAALGWLSQLNTKRDFKNDAPDTAKALSDLLGCPRLAKAHETTYPTRNSFIKKIVDENYSTCVACSERFGCMTTLPLKIE